MVSEYHAAWSKEAEGLKGMSSLKVQVMEKVLPSSSSVTLRSGKPLVST